MTKRKSIFKLQKTTLVEPINAIMTVHHHTDYMPHIVSEAKRIVPENTKGWKKAVKHKMVRRLLKVRSVEHEHQY